MRRWQKKRGRVFCSLSPCLLAASSRHAFLGACCLSSRASVRSSSRSSSRPSARLCLLASYVLRTLLSHSLVPARLIRSPRVPLLASSCSLLLIVSSSRPCLVSLGYPSHRQAGRGETTIDGGRSAGEWRRLLASGCGGWRTASAVIGGGGGCGLCGRRWLLACLVAMGGAARSSSLSHLIGSSNRLRSPGSSNRFGSRVIPSTGRGFFSFSPDPLPPTLLCLLAVACSPVPGRGMCGLRYGLRRRACGLLACVLISRSALSLPLVRSLLYASCRSCRCACPGRCGAFYGLFLPLTCRRWRF